MRALGGLDGPVVVTTSTSFVTSIPVIGGILANGSSSGLQRDARDVLRDVEKILLR